MLVDGLFRDFREGRDFVHVGAEIAAFQENLRGGVQMALRLSAERFDSSGAADFFAETNFAMKPSIPAKTKIPDSLVLDSPV